MESKGERSKKRRVHITVSITQEMRPMKAKLYIVFVLIIITLLWLISALPVAAGMAWAG
jgi:hypothetical protein